MAKNEIFHDANFLSLPVPAGTKSGDPVRIGGLNAVAQTNRKGDAADNPLTGPEVNLNPAGNASCALVGGWEFIVNFAVTAVGQPIYITSANALSATATDNNLFGHAITTKTSGDGALAVRISN